MPRKDYQLIAKAISEADKTPCAQGDSRVSLDSLIAELSSRLVEDNENFDEVRFRAACKVGS